MQNLDQKKNIKAWASWRGRVMRMYILEQVRKYDSWDAWTRDHTRLLRDRDRPRGDRQLQQSDA